MRISEEGHSDDVLGGRSTDEENRRDHELLAYTAYAHRKADEGILHTDGGIRHVEGEGIGLGHWDTARNPQPACLQKAKRLRRWFDDLGRRWHRRRLV